MLYSINGSKTFIGTCINYEKDPTSQCIFIEVDKPLRKCYEHQRRRKWQNYYIKVFGRRHPYWVKNKYIKCRVHDSKTVDMLSSDSEIIWQNDIIIKLETLRQNTHETNPHFYTIRLTGETRGGLFTFAMDKLLIKWFFWNMRQNFNLCRYIKNYKEEIVLWLDEMYITGIFKNKPLEFTQDILESQANLFCLKKSTAYKYIPNLLWQYLTSTIPVLRQFILRHPWVEYNIDGTHWIANLVKMRLDKFNCVSMNATMGFICCESGFILESSILPYKKESHYTAGVLIGHAFLKNILHGTFGRHPLKILIGLDHPLRDRYMYRSLTKHIIDWCDTARETQNNLYQYLKYSNNQLDDINESERYVVNTRTGEYDLSAIDAKNNVEPSHCKRKWFGMTNQSSQDTKYFKRSIGHILVRACIRYKAYDLSDWSFASGFDAQIYYIQSIRSKLTKCQAIIQKLLQSQNNKIYIVNKHIRQLLYSHLTTNVADVKWLIQWLYHLKRNNPPFIVSTTMHILLPGMTISNFFDNKSQVNIPCIRNGNYILCKIQGIMTPISVMQRIFQWVDPIHFNRKAQNSLFGFYVASPDILRLCYVGILQWYGNRHVHHFPADFKASPAVNLTNPKVQTRMQQCMQSNGELWMLLLNQCCSLAVQRSSNKNEKLHAWIKYFLHATNIFGPQNLELSLLLIELSHTDNIIKYIKNNRYKFKKMDDKWFQGLCKLVNEIMSLESKLFEQKQRCHSNLILTNINEINSLSMNMKFYHKNEWSMQQTKKLYEFILKQQNYLIKFSTIPVDAITIQSKCFVECSKYFLNIFEDWMLLSKYREAIERLRLNTTLETSKDIATNQYHLKNIFSFLFYNIKNIYIN